MQEAAPAETAAAVIKVTANFLPRGWDTASVGGRRLGSVLSGRLDGGWNHPTTMGLGCWGQPVLPWSSERQCWHRGMNRARPVASL